MLNQDYRNIVNLFIKKPNKMNCPNCNAPISCGCQKRSASDGKQCCSACINAYEQKLANAKKP